MSTKTFLFGLDGGSLDIIKKMVEEGELPTFEKLMKEGVYGKMESTIPPITIPAWPSMFTGLNPGRLGVADHVRPRRNYEIDVKKPDLRGHYLWDILERKGVRTGVVNVPGVGKVYKINGFMISSLFKDSDAYPKDLQVERNGIRLREADRVSQKIKLLSKNLEESERTLSQLLQKNWDLLVYVAKETDNITHFVDDWPKVREIYQTMDERLSKILDEVDRCNIIIASDHGMKKIRRRLYINVLLERMGFLTRKKGVRESLMSKAANFFQNKLSRSFLQSLISFLPFLGQRRGKSMMSLGMIQKDRTEIFGYGARAGSFARLWINSKENFERGTVGEEKSDSIKQSFRAKARELNQGEKIIEEVSKGAEIYGGKEASWIPDLVAKLPDDCIEDYTFAPEVLIEDKGFAHDLNGVFMAYGPDIKSSGEELEGLKIYDVTPTILHMFGAAVPRNVDGRVLKEIFNKGSKLSEKRIRHEGIKDTVERRRIKEKIRRMESKEKI